MIAADFGHGAISDDMVEVLREHSPFLAVNTQANAGNRGFHAVSRYPDADYVCIAEHEPVRLPNLVSADRRFGHRKNLRNIGKRTC